MSCTRTSSCDRRECTGAFQFRAIRAGSASRGGSAPTFAVSRKEPLRAARWDPCFCPRPALPFTLFAQAAVASHRGQQIALVSLPRNEDRVGVLGYHMPGPMELRREATA
jgi:hypothetical protein